MLYLYNFNALFTERLLVVFVYKQSRDVSKVLAITERELLRALLNGFQPITNLTKNSILNVEEVKDLPQ